MATKHLNVSISAKTLDAIKKHARASGVKLYAYIESVLSAHLKGLAK